MSVGWVIRLLVEELEQGCLYYRSKYLYDLEGNPPPLFIRSMGVCVAGEALIGGAWGGGG